MTIEPLDYVGSWKQYTITGHTAKAIEQVIGFPPNVEDDPNKVKNSWCFTADGHPCAVWDWKGSEKFNEFSAFGPEAVICALFGHKNVVVPYSASTKPE